MGTDDRDERSEWAEQMPDFGPDTPIHEGKASRASLTAMLGDDEQNDFESLAELAEAGRLVTIEGTTARGEDAARIGRSLLMAATGADTLEEATLIALDRPTSHEGNPTGCM